MRWIVILIKDLRKIFPILNKKIVTFNKEIEILKERQIFVSEIHSSTSSESKEEEIPKCYEFDVLKNKVEDLHNTLANGDN